MEMLFKPIKLRKIMGAIDTRPYMQQWYILRLVFKLRIAIAIAIANAVWC